MTKPRSDSDSYLGYFRKISEVISRKTETIQRVEQINPFDWSRENRPDLYQQMVQTEADINRIWSSEEVAPFNHAQFRIFQDQIRAWGRCVNEIYVTYSKADVQAVIL